MKKTSITGKKLTLLSAILFSSLADGFAQFNINSGTYVSTSGNVQIVISSLDLAVAGKLNGAGSTISFSGGDNAVSGVAGAINFANLTVNKTIGKQLLLNIPLTVTGKLTFVSGNIELNNQGISLNNSGSFLNESEISRVTGSNGGWVKATALLNAPNAVNIGNLGAVITSAANLGTVTVMRRCRSKYIAGAAGKSITRSLEITTSYASPATTLTLKYLDAELNGINENNLTQFRSTDGTNFSNLLYSSRSTAGNYVTQLISNSLGGNYTVSSATALAPLAPKNDHASLTPFKIIPNPVQEIATVLIGSAENGNGRLVLLNAGGQQVLQLPVLITTGINQYQLNMSAFNSGVYNLVLVQDGAVNKGLTVIKK